MKKLRVLSLGGSLIIPEEIDMGFLKEFRKIILKNSRKHKFIIVCGGGGVARKYIHALGKMGMNSKFQDMSGISATRMNARFMSHVFGLEIEKGVPHSFSEIREYLKKQDVVFCGALKYKTNQTTDTAAARIAAEFGSDFINLTNVQGLYDKNPAKSRNAKFIPEISFRDFHGKATKKKIQIRTTFCSGPDGSGNNHEKENRHENHRQEPEKP